MEQYRACISISEGFLSGRCESFKDCTYFVSTSKYQLQCQVNLHLDTCKLRSQENLYIVEMLFCGTSSNNKE